MPDKVTNYYCSRCKEWFFIDSGEEAICPFCLENKSLEDFTWLNEDDIEVL